MPMAGVRFGGGPEYQLPSQETLVLAKAAVWASVSAPLTMIPRFGLFEELLAGAAAGAAAGVSSPAALGAVTAVAAALAIGEALEVGTTTGAAATVLGMSATTGVDVLALDSAPTAPSVTAEFTVDNGVLELASVGEAVRESTGEKVPAWTGTGA